MPAAIDLSSAPPVADPAPGAGSLLASNVSYRVGRKLLLDGVTAQLDPQKLLAVVGPNGAGKTTLLRLLAGEIVPHSGEILLDGQPLSRWPGVDRARRLAVLPQHSTLEAGLTVLETTLLGRSPHLAHTESATNLEIARAALSAVDGAHLEARLYPSLSGGEKSRVQTARVMAQIWEQRADDPGRFLLLDEPTAALDLAHQHWLLDSVQGFARQNVAVLAVMHDLNLAAQYADQILVLAEGRVAVLGAPEDVLQPDLLTAVFGMELMVVPHPRYGWPLVLPASRGLR